MEANHQLSSRIRIDRPLTSNNERRACCQKGASDANHAFSVVITFDLRLASRQHNQPRLRQLFAEYFGSSQSITSLILRQQQTRTHWTALVSDVMTSKVDHIGTL